MILTSGVPRLSHKVQLQVRMLQPGLWTGLGMPCCIWHHPFSPVQPRNHLKGYDCGCMAACWELYSTATSCLSFMICSDHLPRMMTSNTITHRHQQWSHTTHTSEYQAKRQNLHCHSEAFTVHDSQPCILASNTPTYVVLDKQLIQAVIAFSSDHCPVRWHKRLDAAPGIGALLCLL